MKLMAQEGANVVIIGSRHAPRAVTVTRLTQNRRILPIILLVFGQAARSSSAVANRAY